MTSKNPKAPSMGTLGLVTLDRKDCTELNKFCIVTQSV